MTSFSRLVSGRTESSYGRGDRSSRGRESIRRRVREYRIDDRLGLAREIDLTKQVESGLTVARFDRRIGSQARVSNQRHGALVK